MSRNVNVRNVVEMNYLCDPAYQAPPMARTPDGGQTYEWDRRLFWETSVAGADHDRKYKAREPWTFRRTVDRGTGVLRYVWQVGRVSGHL